MDFSLSDEQQSIVDLAAQILNDKGNHERLREIETGGGDRFDPVLWKAFAAAGLLGIAIPEAYGGGGLGFLELSLIIEQVGRRTAAIPFLETTVLGALPLAEFGSEAQKEKWLPRVAAGDAILTAALVEGEGELARPGTQAVQDGDGFSITGSKLCVPAGQLAACVLVPAAIPDGRIGVFLVDPHTSGVEIVPLETTSGQPEVRMDFSGVRVAADAVLGSLSDGRKIVEWLELRATSVLCSLASGVCEEALAVTAEYIKTRKQFGSPIATFQAVGQRAADAYIDTEAVRLTALQAAWRIDAGLPAESQVAVAKFWAAEGGQRIVHTAQHLHGGVGVDREYPVHRYFLYAKQLELTLGGATPQLLKVGRILAAQSA